MYNEKRVYAVILAAGSGKRMGTEKKKQFLELKGVPLFYYAFEAFSTHPAVDGVILVTAEEDILYMKDLLLSSLEESGKDASYMMGKFKGFAAGGEERYDSVAHALEFLEQGLKNANLKEDPIVLIHDGARPFVGAELIDRVLETAEKHAAVPGVPVKDTIRVVEKNGIASASPDRTKLYAMQTPQGFPFTMLKKAYEKFEKDRAMGTCCLKVTDDAMLVEQYLKEKVRVVEGSYQNLKLTTPEDLKVAETYLQ